MRDEIVTALGFAVLGLVVLSLAVYGAYSGMFRFEENATFGVVGIIVVFATYVLWDRVKNASRGFSTKDERLVTINYRAGYYGFIAAIWTAVGAPFVADVLFGRMLEGHIVTAIVVVVSGLVFAASYLYLARKGN